MFTFCKKKYTNTSTAMTTNQDSLWKQISAVVCDESEDAPVGLHIMKTSADRLTIIILAIIFIILTHL